MDGGVVEGITLVVDESGAIRAVDAVHAEPGRGLDGDYHSDLTLIASEALEGLERDTGVRVPGAATRRNVVTRGVDLNALVGRRFRVGEAECLGQRLCEPCSHLERLTTKGVLRGLIHRGGLRADILTDGRIGVGATIESLE